MCFAGSPGRGKTRTFLTFSILAAADRRKRPTRWQAVFRQERRPEMKRLTLGALQITSW